MSYNAQTTANHGQSANDADGITTLTMPGAAGDLVVLAGTINNATAISTCTDNGDAGNPWTRLNSPNPDVVSSNNNISVWAKKLGTADVGATVTYDGGAGAVRLPVAVAAFSGRGTVADIELARDQDTTAGTGFNPADLVIASGTGWDILTVTASRTTATTQATMTTTPTDHTKRSEAATSFGTSPNFTVTITSRDGVGAGTYAQQDATFSQSMTSTIGYTLGLKANVAPTAGAGSDQIDKAAGALVTLSGSDSDSDGTVVTRAWTQLTGTPVTLSGAATATATFTVPSVGADETLTFRYTATDNNGATTSDDCSVGILADVVDDGGLRIYAVDSGGTKQECTAYVVDSGGTKVELANAVEP